MNVEPGPAPNRLRPDPAILAGLAAVTAGVLWLAIVIVESRLPLNYSPIFRQLLFFMDPIMGIAGVTLGSLALLAVRRGFNPGRIASALGRHTSLIAILVFLALSAATRYCYLDHPLSMDEYAARFQARIFAAGHVTGRFPAVLVDWLVPPPFVNTFLTASTSTGEVASGYWPGFALLLAPFEALGVPWACNPLLAAVCVILIARLARTLSASDEAAGWTVLLALASPAFAVNASSYYSMTAHLAANLGYALLLLRPTRARCTAAGVVGSVALVLHNPIPHVLFALPWLAWLAWREDRAKNLVSLALGYAPVAVVVGVGWAALRADLVASAVTEHPGAAMGFAAFWLDRIQELFAPPGWETLALAVAYVAKLGIWASPGLVPLAILGAWAMRRDPVARRLAASAALTAVGYLFFRYDQGHGWGYRYFHSAWAVVPLFAAVAVIRLKDFGATGEGLRRFVMAGAIAGLLVLTPLQFGLVGAFVREQLAQRPAYPTDRSSLVFIDYRRGFYTIDLVQNDPFLRDDTVYMASRGPREDAALVASHFPGSRLLAEQEYGTVWEFGTAGMSGVPTQGPARRPQSMPAR
jgi:hypothetical protein